MEKRINTNLRNCQSRAPLFLQDIKTDAPIAVDIRMENLRLECNLQNVINDERTDRYFRFSWIANVHV